MSNDTALILASKSAARCTMLSNAGFKFEVIPSSVDEISIIKEMTADDFYAQGIALELAKRKALDVSKTYPDALVIGSDQMLEFNGQMMGKTKTPEEAKEKLRMLRGNMHSLISAVSVAKDGHSLWQHIDDVHLEMRDFDDEFLDLYCLKAGDALVNCVGGYEFENLGSWLFSSIKGDYFTILGMPLLPLLSYLYDHHGIKP